jgi:hypothetical protein
MVFKYRWDERYSIVSRRATLAVPIGKNRKEATRPWVVILANYPDFQAAAVKPTENNAS